MTLKNKYLTAFCAFLTLLAIGVGCTNNSKSDEDVSEKSMSLSAADTTQVINMMNQYFDLLLKKDFDGALSMLSQLRDDSLVEMSPDLQNHYQIGMRVVSPIRYKIESMIFESDQDCLVKYSAALFEKEDLSDTRPNKMFYAIKPVRINGVWHLTVADDDDLNTRDSNIQK